MGNKFDYDSNYNSEANFSRIRFGHDSPLLETELNEMQVIQEKNRTSITRRLVPSGFIELIQKEYIGYQPILYNPSDSNGMLLLNHIAIAPSRAIVNGHELTLEGNFNNGYVLVDVGESPINGIREDLIYLEMWFETATGQDQVKKWGYQQGYNIGYKMVDSRVNQETSRRIVLCWDIKIANGVNFNNGWFNNIRASANGKLASSQLRFVNASNQIFQNCEFYKDNNLWVAGNPSKNIEISNIYDKFVFALPLFRVKRRNQQKYSIDNLNGALKYDPLLNKTYSERNINGGARPDKLYYDYIVPQDVIDLRKSISVKEFRSEYYLDTGLRDLFTGKLQTKDTNQIRRVQFGASHQPPGSNTILVSKFDGDVIPEISGVSNPNYYVGPGQQVFKDCVNGQGLLLNGELYVEYDLPPSFSKDQGTVDFFFQPYWHGVENISQSILSIVDKDNDPIFKFEKKDTNLILYYYSNKPNIPDSVITVNVDLKDKIILARNIYHVRISWSAVNNINLFSLYINGSLCNERRRYVVNPSMPSKVRIGGLDSNTSTNHRFVIEDLMMYNASFEKIAPDQTIYNNTWGVLPKDFIDGNTLLLPSFNGTSNTFSDNDTVQENAIKRLKVNSNVFTLKTASDKIISDTKLPIVYEDKILIDGSTSKLVINGEWNNLNTNEAIFTSETEMKDVIVQYDIVSTGGSGGYDLPNEILYAGFIKNNRIEEISFNRKGKVDPREIRFSKSSTQGIIEDVLFDYSLDRDYDECHARVLYYNVNANGTSEYIIPKSLYGYEVIGLLDITNRDLFKCEKIGSDGFEIELTKSVPIGEIIEFKLSLGGCVFDYQTHSKTLITNIHKTKILTFRADGSREEYVIPCYSGDNGGVLKSTLHFRDSDDFKYPVCFIDNAMEFKKCTIHPDSYGTPFLKIKFSGSKIPDGTIIEVPVLVSYQPDEDDIISVWYNHIPYQGILSNSSKNLKRISNWKYFITTLSSGNVSLKSDVDNIYSLNNIINRLPGGLSYSYEIDGKPIRFKHMIDALSNSNIKSQLIFNDDVYFNDNLDDSIFILDTEFYVEKNGKGFQDGNVLIKCKNRVTNMLETKTFKLIFPDCAEEFSKYVGMASLVLDENGELLLFVVGDLDRKESSNVELTSVYGDLFRINGLPTTIPQY